MCKNDKVIGPFWVVWDKIVGPVAPFDDKEKVYQDGQYWKLNVDREKAWEETRAAFEYPKKPVDHYPHGEVMFDVKNHRFTVSGTPKLMNDLTFQRKLIRQYGLNSFTQFIKE